MSRWLLPVPVAATLAVILMTLAPSGDAVAAGRTCARTVTANVVALQQPIWLNRLGASIPDGMLYALARDVVDSDGKSCDNGVGSKKPVTDSCKPGQVWLRESKRPRPIVLRANEGDCLKIVFTNLLPASPTILPASPAPGAEAAPEAARELAGNAQRRIQVAEEGKAPPSQSVEDTKELAEQSVAEAVAAAGALEPPTTVAASIHVQGMPWVNGPQDDGSYVGRNKSSLVQPGETTSYTLFAEHEGSYLLYSTADDWTNPNVPAGADGGTLAQGLFGAVNIQPSERDIESFDKPWVSEWYRSQVTEQDLCLATKDGVYDPTTGLCTREHPDNPPVIDYQARYPENYKPDPSLSNLPILNMLCTKEAAQEGACAPNEIVHTDLTAIITGPKASNFPSTIPPADQPPALRAIAVLPDRLQPYRELTIIYHESFVVAQAFPELYADPNLPSLTSAADNFGINYGMGGIVSEILANRIGVGPMKDCTECKYEEFFLSSWTVGDPAMVVDNPATNCVDDLGGRKEPCQPATLAKYPDDPSNVYHSYLGDHVRFRVLHGGSDLHHVHHQHAHQWLHTSNSPNADYTDSQSIGPGSSFTMEMTYYGGGNLNQTVGDSIFHCHFYAHFASGMWSMFRVYDTLETGTVLDAAGRPAAGSRALPDGEIAAGSPIPGVVPVPTLPMPLAPAPVRLKPGGKEFEVQLADGTWVSPQQGGTPGPDARNPGYPFFIPGIAGRRAPHPPLDFAYACSDNGNRCSPGDVSLCGAGATCDPLDGGLPRHLIVDSPANQDSMPAPNNSDFSKIVEKLDAIQLAEEGTLVEKIAMNTHSQRLYPSCRPDGNCKGICSDNGAPCTNAPGGKWQCGNPNGATCVDEQVTYVLNGLKPQPGAPYADPCIAFDRKGGAAPNAVTRRYQAADIQLDAIFNKEGWHFPQQRMISLWGDVKDTLDRKRPPEPLFFRANSGDCIEYTLANLVSNIYELDDFQVRTPTDILGQHIHLVKFDVTSSDGAGNGWNYEDGTFAPNEVTERIHAINEVGGLDPKYVGGSGRKELTPKPIKFFGDGPGGTWIGAQATIQRWYSDPIFDNVGLCAQGATLVACTLTDLSKCDPKASCELSAGFCANDPKTTCTAATAVKFCGMKGECVARNDRTLRTVFTHDHFGPSTHQQAGLYAGLVIEPEGSVWHNNEDYTVFGGFDATSGTAINKRFDGGPTSWQAIIETREPDKSYREFLLELQDSTLTYQPFPVPAFDLDAESAVAQKQFTADSFKDICNNPDPKLKRKPWEPCGFCGNDGVCVDDSTGKPVSSAGCLVPVTGSNPCASGQTCQLVFGHLVACTPENFKHCAGEPYDGTGIQPINTVIQSCKLLSGFPSLAWGTSPIDSPVPGKANQAGTPGRQEIVTFFAATNNFSFNYRNEPLFARTTDPFTGAVLSDPRAGDLSYAYSSNAGIVRPNPRGMVCSNYLATACQKHSDCPSGTTDACQWAGFCSDNYALCTATDPGKVLCKDPTTATCLGACDGPGCDTAFPYEALTPGIQPGDPFTPLLRAYAGDDIQIRTLTGAHLNPHNFTIQGMNWLMEPSFVDSGWRNSGVMGISEHFELLSRVPPAYSAGSTDFLYQPGAAALEQAGGNWGLVRAYSQVQPDLAVLPQNKTPSTASFGVCPTTQPPGTTVRNYEVVALTAQQALGGPLVYNNGEQGGVKREDSNAILYFRKGDLKCTCTDPLNCTPRELSECTYPGGDMPEPLVLRANAGDCIKVTLHNAIDLLSPIAGDVAGAKTVPYGCGNDCNQAESNISLQVGFRPQLVAFDAQVSGGANVGLNSISDQNSTVQTAGTGQAVSYTWYAGNIDAKAATDEKRYIPVEFGAANLMSADVINHYLHGLIGGLVIEPKGSTWDAAAGTSALVKRADGSQFREFVVNFTDELGGQVANDAGTIDAINLRTETLQTNSRFASTAACTAEQDQSAVLVEARLTPTKQFPSQLFCPSACTNCAFTPETPIFIACAGESVRFRVLHGGGTNTAQVFEIYGHNWSEAPYMTDYEHCEAPTTQTNLWASREQGTTNLCANQAFTLERTESAKADQDWLASLNTWQGSRMGHGPSNHLDILIAQAGGPFKRPGDYLYRSFPSMHFQLGVWGLFRVVDPKLNPQTCGPTIKPDKALQNQWEASRP